MEFAAILNNIGSLCFGAVIGWYFYYSLLRWKEHNPSQMAGAIAALLGGVITGFFEGEFSSGTYGIGVAIGFFSFALSAHKNGVRIHQILLSSSRGIGKGEDDSTPPSDGQPEEPPQNSDSEHKPTDPWKHEV